MADFRKEIGHLFIWTTAASQARKNYLDVSSVYKLMPALAWLLSQKPWIVPIPGTTRLARLDENLGAVRMELTANDLSAIDTAAAQIKIEGARYPEALEALTGR